jgi:hypothetical protein
MVEASAKPPLVKLADRNRGAGDLSIHSDRWIQSGSALHGSQELQHEHSFALTHWNALAHDFNQNA